MYFKVHLPKDPEMLPVYAEAPNGPTAIKKVERLLGPLKGAVATQVKREEIPEGETLF
jgi:hypothetical protein